MVAGVEVTVVDEMPCRLVFVITLVVEVTVVERTVVTGVVEVRVVEFVSDEVVDTFFVVVDTALVVDTVVVLPVVILSLYCHTSLM